MEIIPVYCDKCKRYYDKNKFAECPNCAKKGPFRKNIFKRNMEETIHDNNYFDVDETEKASSYAADEGETEKASSYIADEGETEKASSYIADEGETEKASSYIADEGETEKASSYIADEGETEKASSYAADEGATEKASSVRQYAPVHRNVVQSYSSQPVSLADIHPVHRQTVTGSKAVHTSIDNKLTNRAQQAETVSEENETMRVSAYQGLSNQALEPVVGWLIVLDGQEKGKDYRLVAGKNSIGRTSSNHICLANDQAVSRENHATVMFDPRNMKYFLIDGGGDGIIYVNGNPLLQSAQLQERDVIEVGQTRLLFVPLCNETFRWEEES